MEPGPPIVGAERMSLFSQNFLVDGKKIKISRNKGSMRKTGEEKGLLGF
jgi:hypothetical protein